MLISVILILTGLTNKCNFLSKLSLYSMRVVPLPSSASAGKEDAKFSMGKELIVMVLPTGDSNATNPYQLSGVTPSSSSGL